MQSNFAPKQNTFLYSAFFVEIIAISKGFGMIARAVLCFEHTVLHCAKSNKITIKC